MKQNWKRLLAALLTLAMLLSLCTGVFAASGTPETDEPDQAAYDRADVVLNQAYALARQTSARSDSDGVQSVYDYVCTAPGVVEGSVHMRGEGRVVWQTEDGITCTYSRLLQRYMDEAQTPEDDGGADVQTVSYAARGGAHGSDVYLVEPYYGLDSSFTLQYQTECKRIAEATGGTYTLYKGEAATIDAVAEAVENGGVVVFDSHGSTDYSGANEDYTSGATTSYLCLQSGEGLTAADYQDEHALYGGSNGRMKYYEVDGTAIANHMDKPANNGLLWMAICLGMATDGICAPMLDAGVGVVYGYSQSVTFVGDYCFEAAFYDSLLDGATVSEAIAAMKKTYGEWDLSLQICTAQNLNSSWALLTEEEAVKDRSAFPIVASAEDPYPGHGKVDARQNVYSSWSLLRSFNITVKSSDEACGTVSRTGMRLTAKPAAGYYVSGIQVEPEGAVTVKPDGDGYQLTALREDCTVTVEFSPKTPAQIQLHVPQGVSQPKLEAYVTDSVTLPQPTGKPEAAEHSYHFVGWTEQPVYDTKTAPIYYPAGSSYTIARADTQLYALYQYDVTPEGEEPVYTQLTETRTDWSGTYVITADGVALRCDDTVSGSYMGSAEAAVSLAQAGVTVSGQTLRGVGAGLTVEIEKVSGSSLYAIRLRGTQKPTYLACRSNQSQLNTASDASSSTARWSISVQNGHAVLRNGRYSSRTLQYDAEQGYFRCFSTTETPLTLYAGQATAWYTTLPQPCTHNFAETQRQEPDCTHDGFVRSVCTICSEEKTETLPALGHKFGTEASDSLAQAATCTEAARYYVRCERCGAVSSQQTVASGDPLGHDYARGICRRCGDRRDSGFADVAAGSWYFDAVDFCREQGLMNGVGQNRFAPDAEVTRAQLVTVLYRLAGSPAAGTDSFSDIPAASYYAAAVAWAAQAGIAQGYPDGTFRPQAALSREQLATLLYRYAGAQPGSDDVLAAFPDASAVSAYARPAMAWAVENGLLNGVASGDTATLSPAGTATRAQLAAILMRYQQSLTTSGS